MKNTSTSFEKKTVKRVKPDRRIIDNILNYSKSLVSVTVSMGKTILIVNN